MVATCNDKKSIVVSISVIGTTLTTDRLSILTKSLPKLLYVISTLKSGNTLKVWASVGKECTAGILLALNNNKNVIIRECLNKFR